MELFDTELQLLNTNLEADRTYQIDNVKPGDFNIKKILGNQIVDSNKMNMKETNESEISKKQMNEITILNG